MTLQPKLMFKTAALSSGLTERKVVRSYKKPHMKSDKYLECSIGKKPQNITLKTKKVKQLYSFFPLQIITLNTELGEKNSLCYF